MTDSKGSVLVVSQAYPPEKGGNASRIHDFVHHLADDWDVTVVAPTPCYPPGTFERSWRRLERHEDEGVTVHRLWTWQPADVDPPFASRIACYLLFAVHALLWSLRRHDEYDVVMTSSPPITTGLVALPLGVVLKKRWVLDVRDLWIDVSASFGFITDGGVLDRLCRRYRSYELAVADLVTVTTGGAVVRLTDQYDVAGDVAVIPNGVDADAFAPENGERRRQVIYAGNVGHCQDLEPFVQAMEYVDDDVTFRIVGDGDSRPRLERLVDEAGLDDTVVFEGPVPREQVPPLLNESAVGVAPLKPDRSLHYAVPTKVFEYMACELPVVVLGNGEIQRVVDASGAGVVAEREPRVIAQQLESVMEERATLGERGRTFVEDRYRRRDIASDLSRLLADLVAG